VDTITLPSDQSHAAAASALSPEACRTHEVIKLAEHHTSSAAAAAAAASDLTNAETDMARMQLPCPAEPISVAADHEPALSEDAPELLKEAIASFPPPIEKEELSVDSSGQVISAVGNASRSTQPPMPRPHVREPVHPQISLSSQILIPQEVVMDCKYALLSEAGADAKSTFAPRVCEPPRGGSSGTDCHIDGSLQSTNDDLALVGNQSEARKAELAVSDTGLVNSEDPSVSMAQEVTNQPQPADDSLPASMRCRCNVTDKADGPDAAPSPIENRSEGCEAPVTPLEAQRWSASDQSTPALDSGSSKEVRVLEHVLPTSGPGSRGIASPLCNFVSL